MRTLSENIITNLNESVENYREISNQLKSGELVLADIIDNLPKECSEYRDLYYAADKVYEYMVDKDLNFANEVMFKFWDNLVEDVIEALRNYK